MPRTYRISRLECITNAYHDDTHILVKWQGHLWVLDAKHGVVELKVPNTPVNLLQRSRVLCCSP